MNAVMEKNAIEANPVKLPEQTVQQLVPELDKHLASFFTLFHQYQKHHWLVKGPQYRDLHLFFKKNYEQVHEAADAIAERMTLLGGIPTSSPMEFAKLAYVSHEPEGVFQARDMLERDRECEGTIAERLRKTIKTANDMEDYGTETLLKKILLEVEERADHIDHFLGEHGLHADMSNAH
ncbi:MAG: ferritin-like domain-containing protein [Trueperaceae bacterium]